MTNKEIALTDNAVTVLRKRYLKRNVNGEVTETPEDLFRRVAHHIAAAETLYGKSEEEVKETESDFYELMTSMTFLPNSPTLMNAGRRLGQLSACYVLPVGDSMESIFDGVKYAAIIHKSGGGTGFSFSNLRPSGDIVGSTKGVSSGPISFMKVYDAATEAVKQGGTRRGANMGMLRVDHPDILDFVTCKDDKKQFNNFNISVALTNAFMSAVGSDEEYELINPRTKTPTTRLRARRVFDLIVKQAWKNGEPGIVFIDRLNDFNPTPALGSIESTNPCGEQPLLPYESCNLGSINLSLMVKNGCVDREKLRYAVWKGVRFLDNVIDVNQYPLQQVDEITRRNRKIGLGVMGWADMLVQMGLPYNSEAAIALAGDVMQFIQREGHKASAELAAERGVFPNWEDSTWKLNDLPMRNATVTTIAPTGSLSIIAGCSSGIEPFFALMYERRILDGAKLVEVNRFFQAAVMERDIYMGPEIQAEILKSGSLADINYFPSDLKEIYRTAADISPVDHIRMQAAFQQYVDNAVSKTVNLRRTATEKDVADVYWAAYKSGCKGVTVYRDGSRDEQVLSTQDSKQQNASIQTQSVQNIPKKRPTEVIGKTRLIKTGCGNLYVTINEGDDGKPFEVFTNMGKAGGCAASQSEAVSRLISLALRSNIPSEEIWKQLKGISCHQPSWGEGGKVHSCSDAIGRTLEQFQGMGAINYNGNGNTAAAHVTAHSEDVMLTGACPECGGIVEHEGGCAICHSCGFTKCG